MRPILVLNCLLQIEQERSEVESSVGDASALAFRCARFCSAINSQFNVFGYLQLTVNSLFHIYKCAYMYTHVQSLATERIIFILFTIF